MDTEVSFGAWIARRRKTLDLTREQLAKCVGCSASGLRKIEADERRPSRQIAELLAHCLQIPTDEHPTFLQVARGALRVERLGTPMPASASVWARSAPQRPASNLPTPLTPLIGREPELAALARLLQDPQCRLLTLIGPGGIGKTRLALEVAFAQREAFADGVFFASLASIGSPKFIVPAVVEALGFNLSGPGDPHTQLINYVRDKQLLLFLDNFEHLMNGADLLTQVLASAPELKLLLTSRERLDLRGEWLFEVQGLPVPPPGQAEELDGSSALDLFVQSALRAWSGFQLTADERSQAIHVCRLVEGMRLGIELAAAWVRVLSCREIAQEIEQGLGFLATSARDAPERHRSVHAVFDHSWRLLTEEERCAMRALSIFRGGFQRDAAETVADCILPLLAALAAKSLVRRSSTGRYHLHELVRQYAAERLHEDADEESTVCDRHSAHFAAFVGQQEGYLKGERQLEALAEMSAEIDNLRGAWRWAVMRGHTAEIQKFIKGLWFFYEIRGWFQEAEFAFRWAAEALDRLEAPSKRPDSSVEMLRAFLRANQGWFCLRLGRFEEAQRLLQANLPLLHALDATGERVLTLHHIGVLERLAGDYAQSRAHFQEALAFATRIGDPWGVALAHGNLGLAAQALGEYEEALERLQTANAAFQALGDPRMVAVGLFFLGRLKCTLGAYVEAQAFLRESLTLGGAIGDRWIEGMTLGQLGQIAQAQGEYAEAARLFRESLARMREINERWSMLQALNGLGMATLALGTFQESHSAFCEALHLAWEMQALPDALSALAGMASLQIQIGDAEQAFELLVQVLRHPASSEETKQRATELRSQAETRLTPLQIEAVEAQAQTKAFDAVVIELLERLRE